MYYEGCEEIQQFHSINSLLSLFCWKGNNMLESSSKVVDSLATHFMYFLGMVKGQLNFS